MKEDFSIINGTKICYEVLGVGDPLFLIHGFGAKKETWRAQIGALSEHFKVIRFDNRGAGKSDRPGGSYSMEVFADDLNGLMNYLKIEKAHVIGWSLGGMIVQNFAIKYPERVNKIVLINTNYGFPDASGPEVYKNMRIEEIKLKEEDPEKAFWQSVKMGFHIKFRKKMEAEPSKKWHGLWSAEDLIKESTIDTSTIQDVENQAIALNTHNTYDRLSEIKNETLLLAASHDRLTPKFSIEQIHEKIPNSTLVVIEQAGHDSPLEKALEVNKNIIEFLKK